MSKRSRFLRREGLSLHKYYNLGPALSQAQICDSSKKTPRNQNTQLGSISNSFVLTIKPRVCFRSMAWKWLACHSCLWQPRTAPPNTTLCEVRSSYCPATPRDWRGSDALLGFRLRHIQNPFPCGEEMSRCSHPTLRSPNRQGKLWRVSCPRKTPFWKYRR